MDLALNNLQRLICHKPNQTKPNHKDFPNEDNYTLSTQANVIYRYFSKCKIYLLFWGKYRNLQVQPHSHSPH